MPIGPGTSVVGETSYSPYNALVSCATKTVRELQFQNQVNSFTDRVGSYEQFTRDQNIAAKQQADLAVREEQCRQDYARRIGALQMAIAGRDPG